MFCRFIGSVFIVFLVCIVCCCRRTSDDYVSEMVYVQIVEGSSTDVESVAQPICIDSRSEETVAIDANSIESRSEDNIALDVHFEQSTDEISPQESIHPQSFEKNSVQKEGSVEDNRTPAGMGQSKLSDHSGCDVSCSTSFGIQEAPPFNEGVLPLQQEDRIAAAGSEVCPDEKVSDINPIDSKPTINAIVLLERDEEVDSSLTGVQVSPSLPIIFQEGLILDLKVFIQQEISNDNIATIKKEIIDFYHRKGHPFVTVTTPEQKISNGVIKFVITESRIGTISIQGNDHFKQRFLRKYIHADSGQTIDAAELEKDVRLINRNPFRNSSLIVKPGSENNTTDLELWVSDKRTYRVYAGVDNTGIRTTDYNRFYAGLNLGNLWGLDHIFSYQFTSAFNTERFYSHTALLRK
ncbi:MAG: hypothetical protein HW387_496 [Parachlamydiales bacterium]|nr:hypothetical protein [Parachlamydiales bacterium]